MIRRNIKNLLERVGYTIVEDKQNVAMEEEFLRIYERCKDYTITSKDRMYALYKSVEYIVKNRIPGDVVECGVWRGGSMMLSAFTLLEMNNTERKLYLYDTFDGMSEPTDKDVDYKGRTAKQFLDRYKLKRFSDYCRVPIEETRRNMFFTGYPKENIIFVKGRVEETLQQKNPAAIAVLRLDTDWFESTYQELKCLFPKLQPNGVLILDDYGHLKGAREAADRYFTENGTKILLNKIDYTGRIGVKVS